MTLNLKATVRGGRLVLDEPIDLPDGSEVELAVVEDETLDPEDRARLHAAISLSIEQHQNGATIAAEEVLREL